MAGNSSCWDWCGLVSRDMVGNESDGRDHNYAQLDAVAATNMALCRREGFVDLAESESVEKLPKMRWPGRSFVKCGDGYEIQRH